MASRSARVLAGVAAATAAFGVAWLFMSLIQFPLPWYLPLGHRWVFASKPTGLGMDFFGRVLYAGAVATLAYQGGARLSRGAKLPRERAWLWIGWGLLLAALAMAYATYQIWPRPAQPLPIPAWYRPE